MRFSDQGIRSLPLTEKGQRYYQDESLSGLALCIGTRSKTFSVVLGTGKQRNRVTLGQYDPPHFTLAMAREKAKDLLAQERLKKTETPRITFSAAFELYDRIHISQLRTASQRAIRQTFARRFTTLNKRILDSIRPTDIAPILDELLDTPAERHNSFVYLSMFFNWAMRRGYINTTPTARMHAPKKPPSRERVLTADELLAVWRALPDDDYGSIIKLCILSGQRIGQWAALKREYIQSDVIVWPSEAMKAKRSQTIPLTDMMRTLIPQRVGYIFPTANIRAFSNWSRSKHRLDKDSGLKRFTHHDLRRTWATVAADELDIEPHIIAAVLHHAYGSAVTRIYTRARYIPQMRAAFLAFEGWFQNQKPLGASG
jgi:integrase